MTPTSATASVAPVVVARLLACASLSPRTTAIPASVCFDVTVPPAARADVSNVAGTLPPKQKM